MLDFSCTIIFDFYFREKKLVTVQLVMLDLIQLSVEDCTAHRVAFFGSKQVYLFLGSNVISQYNAGVCAELGLLELEL
jgi:hypothetical protein